MKKMLGKYFGNTKKRLRTGLVSKTLKLAFLWHMHQPYYKDDKENTTLMPWVFLHAIKDYYDIPWYGSKFNKIKATYNLVPSLISQIESYIQYNANDKLLDTIKKDIYHLSKNDIEYLQSYLFLANEQNMIKPLKRYYELYLKYKAHNTIIDFSHIELLDLEVLFLLSWCGNYLREHNPVVKALLKKELYFTQQEKEELLEELILFLPTILDFYKELEQSKKISLCTTPYYHPITPLLLNTQSAKDAKPNVTLPNITSSFEELGVKNTQYAISYFEKLFGKKPSGFWPAEGSVSFSTAELFVQNDLQWFCTDEEILFKTLLNNTKTNIYKNYDLHTESGNIQVRFRDHYLSDAIGFDYSQQDPKTAALEFVKHLKNIYDSCDFSPLVNVILDGENAWEFFPNNGWDFFNELYTLFENTPWLETVTMDDITVDKEIQTSNISTLGTGSWINGNFDIWIGSKEKNQAWELLDITKKEFDKHKLTLDAQTLDAIEKEFMIALGSDWFWWYGDDHFTLQAKEFDDLFRKHLINIYQYLQVDVPYKILTPIVHTHLKNSFHTKPINFIYPKIDGIKSDYFEWLNSGVIDIKKEFSVMDSTKSIIKHIRYGYCKEKLYIFFDGNFNKLRNNPILKIVLNDIEFEIELNKATQRITKNCCELFASNLNDNIELEISQENITLGEKIDFKFFLIQDNLTLQSFPLYGNFTIEIEDLDLNNWYI
jgi:alpha-amylase/alpha-mannosidase (GH57 family)